MCYRHRCRSCTAPLWHWNYFEALIEWLSWQSFGRIVRMVQLCKLSWGFSELLYCVYWVSYRLHKTHFVSTLKKMNPCSHTITLTRSWLLSHRHVKKSGFLIKTDLKTLDRGRVRLTRARSGTKFFQQHVMFYTVALICFMSLFVRVAGICDLDVKFL